MIEYYGDWYLTSCAAADAPSSRRNGPLEMRKVEMGNGIGCITRRGGRQGEGEGEERGERESQADLSLATSASRRRFFAAATAATIFMPAPPPAALRP